MPVAPNFTEVLRGYDPVEVDALVKWLHAALASRNPEVRAAAKQKVRQASFRVVLRGYERAQVDDYLLWVIVELTNS
jgi:DivIVA domain-containing protein